MRTIACSTRVILSRGYDIAELAARLTRAVSPGSLFTTPGFTDELIHAFIATPLEPAPEVARDPDEAIDNVTMTVEEALAACRDGVIRDSKTIATLLLAQLHGWM